MRSSLRWAASPATTDNRFIRTLARVACRMEENAVYLPASASKVVELHFGTAAEEGNNRPSDLPPGFEALADGPAASVEDAMNGGGQPDAVAMDSLELRNLELESLGLYPRPGQRSQQMRRRTAMHPTDVRVIAKLGLEQLFNMMSIQS